MSQPTTLYKFLPHLGDQDRNWEGIKLPEHIILCGCCGGKGRYEQRYTVGCGGGSYMSKGRCDSCEGTGLRLKIENGWVDTSRYKIGVEDVRLIMAQNTPEAMANV